MKYKRPYKKSDPLLVVKRQFFLSKIKNQTKDNGASSSVNKTNPLEDKYEKEAEKKADSVINPLHKGEAELVRQKQIQKQEEEEETQTKIQKQEEEEESVQTKSELQRQPAEEEEVNAKPELQKQEESTFVQTTADKEDEPVQAKSEVANKEANVESGDKLQTVNSNVSIDQLLQKRKGRGIPLPDDIRTEMETWFKADFSRVRIHSDAEAARIAESLKAQAFTRGYDIYFNEGKFMPDTKSGKHLLAHELTHVIQQKGRELI